MGFETGPDFGADRLGSRHRCSEVDLELDSGTHGDLDSGLDTDLDSWIQMLETTFSLKLKF